MRAIGSTMFPKALSGFSSYLRALDLARSVAADVVVGHSLAAEWHPTATYTAERAAT